MNTETTPHRCPVCEGRQKVPASTYGQPTRNMVDCRSCEGSGIVWSMDVRDVTEVTIEMPDEDTPWRSR